MFGINVPAGFRQPPVQPPRVDSSSSDHASSSSSPRDDELEEDEDEDGSSSWDQHDDHTRSPAPYVYVDRLHEMNDNDDNGSKRKNTGGVSVVKADGKISR